MLKTCKKFGKKIMIMCLASVLLLSGCQKEGKVVSKIPENGKKENGTNTVGRYVEKDIPLPDGENIDTIISLEKDWDGNLILFTKDTSGSSMLFHSYTLKEGNKWEKKECKWLDSLKLPSEKSFPSIVVGEDKKLYAFYHISEGSEKSVPVHVVTTSDGSKAEEVNVPELAKEENGLYPYVEELKILSNGNLVISTFGEVMVYHKDSGKVLRPFESEWGKIVTKENTIYHYDTKAGSVDAYDAASGEKLSSKPLSLKETYEARLQIAEDNTLVVYSSEGIQKLKEGSDLWELTVSSTMGTIGSPRFYNTSFIPGSDKDYYVYYKSMDDKAKISHFVFDPDMPLEAENSITVYALKDNSVIRQAVSEFQVKNPNVNINFQVAMGDDTAAVEEDYIRTLNTELLAGKGPDILILDGLPIESFIEKGVLKDISSIILPLVSSGEYLKNIADVYTKDEKIYTVPTKIALPMAFGKQELTKIVGDLPKLADYMGQNPDKKVFGTIDPAGMLSFYLDVLGQNLVLKEGNLDLDQIALMLEQMKKIMDASNLQDVKKEIRRSTEWDLIEEGNLLYTENIQGFFQSQWCFSVIRQTDLSFASVNQTFLPIGKIGINRAGKNQEIAEQFVKEVLSEDAQSTDYYDGFPVNKTALEKYKTIERTRAEAYGGSIDGADGKTYEMRGWWPMKEHREKVIEICETVMHEASFDTKLKAMILEKTVEYFTGNQSLEETIEAILQASKAYLAE